MAVNVARIYEQTIRPGRPYCRICLRTATETSLVTPRKLLQFTEALKLNIFDGKRRGSVCYLCEAAAATAFRLYQACINAVSVKTCCKPLKNMKPSDPVPESLRKSIVGCNAHLKDYRERTSLRQTEVLVVDSIGIAWQTERDAQETTRIAVPPIAQEPTQYETVVLDDDDEETPAQNQTMPTEESLPKLVPIERLLDPKSNTNTNIASFLPNQMQIISRCSGQSNSFVLHPVITGKNGGLVAPSLGGQVKDGQLVYDPTLYEKLPLIDCTGMTYIVQNKSDTSKPENNVVPVQINQNGQNSMENEEILPDVGPSRTKRQRVYGTDSTFKVLPDQDAAVLTKTFRISTKKPRILTRNPVRNNSKQKNTHTLNSTVVTNSQGAQQYVVNLDLVNNLITGDSNCKNSDQIVITNVISTSDSVGSDGFASDKLGSDGFASDNLGSDGFGVVKEVVSRAPRLVEKSDNVDWEDKIPMDVISFVDSADPCTKQLIVPAAPANQAPPAIQAPILFQSLSTVQLSTQTEPSVIDLC